MNPLAWSSGTEASEITLQQALEQIALFANAHLALSDENQLLVYACSALSRSAAPMPPQQALLTGLANGQCPSILVT